MSKEMRKQINKVKNFGQFLNEDKEDKMEYVIVDMTSGSKYPFYDKGSNSFFRDLPFATFFKSLDRCEKVLKLTQTKHPDKKLEVKNVDDVDINMGWR
jgi:hypothetical protein